MVVSLQARTPPKYVKAYRTSRRSPPPFLPPIPLLSPARPIDPIDALYKHAESRLVEGERIMAYFETDLDASLHFHSGLIILSDRRLMHVEHPRNENIHFRAWKLNTIDDLLLEELGATAAIHLKQGGTIVHEWRATSGCMREADAFLARFKERKQAMLLDGPVQLDEPVPADDDDDDVDEPDPFASTEETTKHRPLLRLLFFCRPWYRLLLLGLLLTTAFTAASLIAPWLTMGIVDDVLIKLQSTDERPHVKHVYRFPLYLAGAAVLTWMLNWASTFVVARLAERVSSRMRRETFEHLQKLSLSFFNRKRTGDLISRIGSDTDHISLFISTNLIDFSKDVLMGLGIAGILFSINPILALAALGPMPIVGFLAGRVRGHLRGGFAAASRAWSQMNSVLSDTIPGVRVVKAFAQEHREVARFRAADQHIFDTNDRVNKTWSFFTPMVDLLTDFGLITVWAVGAWCVAHDSITVGVLSGFVMYISRFYGRVESMSRFFASAQRAATSAHRIFELLDVNPDMMPTAGSIKVDRLKGEIDFRDVKFRHGARQVIKGVNLTISPGEMIGLVGASGAGKTTLVNLACRFFDVSEGRILVDGEDLRDLNIEDYRRNVGLVLQEPYLFYGTIAENIAYGKPNASRDEIIAAARAARAHDFILRQIDGYDSMVGERGQQLSGGERQRISIARALLIDPAILILDEATSAVDTETEREIQAALDALTTGRTTIAIAHRLGTLRKANRLVVMQDGLISEIGTHEQLMKSSGIYARLHAAMQEVNHV